MNIEIADLEIQRSAMNVLSAVVSDKIKEAFQVKEWNSKEGEGRKAVGTIISEFVKSQEFKSMVVEESKNIMKPLLEEVAREYLRKELKKILPEILSQSNDEEGQE